MIIRFACILTLLTALILEDAFSQASFEQRRAEIREQQQHTRSEIESLEEQIETYRNRLNLATERYDGMYSQYQELTRLIAVQDEQLRRMQLEQQQIVQELNLIESNLNELEIQLNQLIEQYQQTLSYLYKHGRTTEVALLLTSASINQLLVRSHYLAKFDEYRSDQERQIRAKQEEFEIARGDLDNTRKRNSQSLQEIENQKQELAEREQQQKRNVELLQNDIDNWESQLAQKEDERRQLDRILSELVEEEEALAGGGLSAARVADVSDEELMAFETAFSDSRGQLPWPVENGTVVERFGNRVHPVLRTTTQNLGIDIAAPARSQVQVVNDGYVLRVQPVTGYGDMVMVRHGRYITAYGNLSEYFVTRGDVLRKGDVIGLSGDENSIRGEVLFFVIRDGSSNVNPESWIQRTTP
jgi:murein hydrolase activator